MLITDVAGSTDMRVRLGAEGERLLALQETLAREAVAAHDGSVVKGLGDGAMAVFDAAADALAAAVRLQRQLDTLHRRDDATELRLRIGISSGDVAVGPDDCYGLPVAEAVRLCAAAEPGEILVADVSRALARRVDVPMTPVGELTLKGLRDPVSAWRIAWAPTSRGWDGVPMPPRLAPAPTGFVGRLGELDRMLETARPVLEGGDRRLQLLVGEPGVGKSAFAAEIARRLWAETGAVVLHGICDEELRPPYQPFAHALRHLVRHAPTAALDDYVRRFGGELSIVVPELADRVGRMPAPRASFETSDRHLLFRAIAGLLESMLNDTPMVLVLDDLQWADRGTLLLLRHLLTGVDLSRLVVLATCRTADAGSAPYLSDLLSELHRIEGVDRLELGGLSAAEVGALARTVLGADPGPAILDVVVADTGGNAFFAGELLRHVRETHVPAHFAVHDLPASVRDVIGQRVRRLGDDVAGVLSVAAVLGAEFTVPAVADLAGMPTDIALDLLEQATSAAILQEVRGTSRFRFVHALVQRTLYDQQSGARQHRLHRLAAEAMERLGAPPAAVGFHWVAAADMGDPLRAMAACTAAADESLRQRAPDEAVWWYLSALHLVGDGDDEVRCELLLRLGDAQRLAGDPNHRVTLQQAAEMAQRLGDPERMGRAALAKTRWFASSVSSNGDQQQVALLESALAAVGPEPTPQRARLLATLAVELVYTDRSTERFAAAEQALQVAHAVDDSEALFDVLFWRAPVIGRATGAGDAELAEMHELVAHGRDPLRQAMADLITVLRSIERGDVAAGELSLQRAIRIADELRLPVLAWLVTVLRATVATVRADLVNAEALAGEGLAISRSTDQPDATTWYGVQLFMVRYEQGRLQDLAPLFESAIARGPRLANWHAALALAHAETGRHDEARVVVTQLLDSGYPARRSEPHWLIGMMCLASAAPSLGDPDMAGQLYDALLPYAGQWPSIMAMTLGCTDRVLGELAHVRGRLDDAERHLRTAIDLSDRGGAPGVAARARIALVRVLLDAGRDVNDAEVGHLVDEVQQRVARHGLARAAALLTEALAAAPGRTTVARPTPPLADSLPTQPDVVTRSGSRPPDPPVNTTNAVS